jgi:hypothetical protein
MIVYYTEYIAYPIYSNIVEVSRLSIAKRTFSSSFR